MKSITITFISRPDGYEDIETEADGFAREHILEAIGHALLQLQLHGDRPEKLTRVK